MAPSSFPDFFAAASGFKPYPYQSRLADELDSLSLLRVPTGAGKTAGVTLAWLWRRHFHPDLEVRRMTPRRLVYCLPMRVLVEQTRDCTASYLRRLGLAANDSMTSAGDAVSLHVLMGGDQDNEELLTPERECIIIGTQDMLLSRALNRGFGLSRFRWPAAFGLLNNDCLWVFDEIQLMGVGLETSSQLAAFREKLGGVGPCASLWMSATLQPDWLRTVDHGTIEMGQVLELSPEDKSEERLAQRLDAFKRLERMGNAADPKALAGRILAEHRRGTRTMAVVNTVARARAIHGALTSMTAGKRKDGEVSQDHPEVLLIHSRFRPADRRALVEKLISPLPADGVGRIVISTQVVEAGIDVSATTLITDLAPWSSLVQRFGRCNREGKDAQARVFWIDLDSKSAAPYRAEDLTAARELLQALEGKQVGPSALPEVPLEREEHRVIRSRDLVGLFDTMPDLSGNDVDVSRFIRDGDELDVQLFWRPLGEKETPPEHLPRPRREELCAAPVGEVRTFVEAAGRGDAAARRTKAGGLAWMWDQLAERWRRVRPGEIRPGQLLMLRAADGGYSRETGWDLSVTGPVDPLPPSGGEEPPEGTASDPATFAPGAWRTLAGHCDDVVAEVDRVIEAMRELPLEEGWRIALRLAARWHDAGKSHPVFRETLLKGLNEAERVRRSGSLWAKSASRAGRHSRPHFRHELASALAFRQNRGLLQELPRDVLDLAVYLVAAHHGRVRLSIRSMPDENAPPDGRRLALGILDGDELPEVDLGGGVTMPATALDLSPMQMGLCADGCPSWLEISLGLRDARHLGPFRLAFLESLLRASDARASMGTGKEAARDG